MYGLSASISVSGDLSHLLIFWVLKSSHSAKATGAHLIMISNLLMHLLLLTTLSASSRYQVLSLVSSTIRNHSSLLCPLSSTRRSFIANTLPTLQMATARYYSPTPTSVNQAVQLLDSVYGPVTSNDFPLPMRPYEAGPCKDKEQRRYLWTDAFAVMAYQSLAEYYIAQSNIEEAKIYQTAVDKLINVVHDCLGKPRSVKQQQHNYQNLPKMKRVMDGMMIMMTLYQI